MNPTIERTTGAGMAAAHGSARLWLCSEPYPSDDGGLKPASDDEGSKVTAKNEINADTAAEIGVETSGRDMSDGDELAVWVWRPGDVSGAKEYFVRVSLSWNFSARLNDPAPITHGGTDRRYKRCKCNNCGVIETCTPSHDFYTTNSATGPLLCQSCFWEYARTFNSPNVLLGADVESDGCISTRTDGSKHAEMDAYGKANFLTVVFAPWHPNPEYRIFKTGSLLSRNEEFPSGLVIVNERGAPQPWQAPNPSSPTPP